MGADMQCLVDTFRSSTQELIADIRAGAQQHDPKLVKFHTHTLQSASASVGALNLSRLAAEWGGRVGSPQFADWEAVAPALQAEFDRVCQALQQLAPVISVDGPVISVDDAAA